MNQEYYGSILRGSYALGIIHIRIPNPIPRDVKTHEDLNYLIYIHMSRIDWYINEHEVSMMEDLDYDSHILIVRGSS